MKAAPIIVPDLSRYAARANLAARMAATAPGGRPIGMAYVNHAANHAERPAVRGFACVYNQVFDRDGVLHAFVRGCFTASLATRRDVKMQLEHQQNIVFGSTRNGLSFIDAEEGLAFEFEVPKNQAGAMLVSMVASGNRPDVSVGVDILETITKPFRGHNVRMIVKANLREISACKEGAVSQSHVRLVDLAEAQPLSDELANGTVAFMGRMNEITTSAKDRIARLEHVLDDADAEAVAPRERRAYTVDGYRVAPD